MSTPYALEMRNITKDFPGVRALRNASLQVGAGEIHCLLGENGAGKSTLMRILNGVHPVGTYTGEVRVRGQTVEFRSPREARLNGIGFVPQEITVIEHLNVAENIFVGDSRAGGTFFFRPARVRRRAAEFLHLWGIALDPACQVSTLNAGERQLVMIARALSQEPSVLILDEPTSALTATETENLFTLLRRLKHNGASILFISHKLDELSAIGDRVTVLRDGAVVAAFTQGDFQHDDLIAAMAGRRIETLFPPREAGTDNEEVLRVEDLSLPHPRRRHRQLLAGIRFSVRRGEILGVAGVIGSGRSELLNALYGRIPYRGRIFVEGREVRLDNPAVARQAGIGLVVEERKHEGLLFNLSLRENISLNHLSAVSRGGLLSRSAETAQARECMRRLGIQAPSATTPVGNLSGGNQQKVLLARALLAQPRVLLLNEPTKGIDVGAKHEIYQLLRDLTRQGMALVLVSSELPELLGLCDRFIVLARGGLTDSFDRTEASEHRLLRAATGTGPAALPT